MRAPNPKTQTILTISRSINGSSQKFQQTHFLRWDLAYPPIFQLSCNFLGQVSPLFWIFGHFARLKKIIHAHLGKETPVFVEIRNKVDWKVVTTKAIKIVRCNSKPQQRCSPQTVHGLLQTKTMNDLTFHGDVFGQKNKVTSTSACIKAVETSPSKNSMKSRSPKQDSGTRLSASDHAPDPGSPAAYSCPPLLTPSCHHSHEEGWQGVQKPSPLV